MSVNTKREKRRQASLERAYWHVREVMQFLGRAVADARVPEFLPEDCYYGAQLVQAVQNKHSLTVWGLFLRSGNYVMVRNGDSVYMEETLYHEVCHANQPYEDETDIPYWERPREIEAREIAAIAFKLRRVPRAEWTV